MKVSMIGKIKLKKYCVSSLISFMFQCSRKRDSITVDSQVLVDIGFVQDIRARDDVVVYKVLNLMEESKEILCLMAKFLMIVEVFTYVPMLGYWVE